MNSIFYKSDVANLERDPARKIYRQMGTETSARQQLRHQHDNNSAKTTNGAPNFGAASMAMEEGKKENYFSCFR